MLSIVKRNSTYYFRIRVPSDVRKYFPSEQIRYSLHTGLYKTAKSLARGKLGALEKVFMTIRAGILTDDEINRLVDKYKREQLAKGEEIFDIVQGKGGENIKDLRAVLGEYYAETLGTKKHILLNERGQDGVNIAAYTSGFKKLCREVALANKEVYTNLIERNETGDSEYDRQERAKPKSKTLKEVITIYEAEKLPIWRDKNKVPAIHRRILHLFGNVRLNDIDRESCLTFRENLKEYPFKNEDYKTPWKTLAKSNPKRLSDRTQHDTMVALTTLFEYAVTMDTGLRGNFAKNLSGSVKDCKRVKVREEYSVDELNRMIVALAEVNKAKFPHYYWLPLILLYTGCRANEACQLRCEDIFDGSIHIRHKPELFQTTKSGKNRIVPVHSVLVRLGFLDFVSTQQKAGNERLFPVLRKKAGKWESDYGKYFLRNFKCKFLEGYTETELLAKDLHTFRKTYVSWFIGSGLIDTINEFSTLQALVGHTTDERLERLQEFMGKAKLILGTYSDGFKNDLKVFADRLDYGIDLTPLFNP